MALIVTQAKIDFRDEDLKKKTSCLKPLDLEPCYLVCRRI